jgi:hypothetical protein
MRINKTQGRAAPKVSRATSQSKARSKASKKSEAPRALKLAAEPSQLSGMKLAMQRLAAGLSKLEARPLSGPTAQEALAGLRGE